MKILLIDVDSKIPNMALMKISTFHKNQGDEVNLIRLKYGFFKTKRGKTDIANGDYDKVYASIIFTNNKDMLKFNNPELGNYLVGGSGTLDFSINLPQEIESLEEDYSLYPENKEALGFISRGCIRDCSFCIVRKKEGYLHKYRDWRSIVNTANKYGLKKIRFLDNNFLANPDCEKVMQELIDNKINCSFNEGLDFRLIDDKKAALLSKLNYYPANFTFAFDNISYLPLIEKQYALLRKYIPQDYKIRFYCYVHPDMPLKDTIQRIKWCKKNKCLPYLTRDVSCWDSPNVAFYNNLSAYCNQPGLFKKLTWEKFLNKRTNNQETINSCLKLWQ